MTKRALQRKPSKYRAVQVPACGHCWADLQRPNSVATCTCQPAPKTVTFRSKHEFRRWHELLLREKAGYIRNLTRQPAFEFAVKGKKIFTYRGDARYYEGERQIVEDSKGLGTPVYRLKKRLIEAFYSIEILPETLGDGTS